MLTLINLIIRGVPLNFFLLTLIPRILDFLKNVFSVSSSFTKIPVVRADDDEDEEELVDPQEALRVSNIGQVKHIVLSYLTR